METNGIDEEAILAGLPRSLRSEVCAALAGEFMRAGPCALIVLPLER